jgi:hypothetical protein
VFLLPGDCYLGLTSERVKRLSALLAIIFVGRQRFANATFQQRQNLWLSGWSAD